MDRRLDENTGATQNPKSIPFNLLKQATKSFADSQVIGHGGFGDVYLGELQDGQKVAVKRQKEKSRQGQPEFLTEIKILSKLNNCNLVSLIGYCDEGNEMILVYEYMENGTLSSHLYGSDKPSLSWLQRLNALIGAAKGLQYLHINCEMNIIHRDIKSANILLDEKFCTKISDLGISKGPMFGRTHVTTQIKGSCGYIDPEYYKTELLTKKSDVYSFGVVMLEVLCGRPAVDGTLPRDKRSLSELGIGMLKKGELEQIVDKKISGKIKPQSLERFGKIVEKCLEEKSVERPSMSDVLRDLECVQQLETALTRSLGKVYKRGDDTGDVRDLGERFEKMGTILTRSLGKVSREVMRQVMSGTWGSAVSSWILQSLHEV